MKKVLIVIALFFTGISSYAQNSVSLTWKYFSPGALTIFANNGTTPLSGAGTSANGDGFVLQLGYYSSATAGNPFAGTWVPVFGPGTSNSLFSTAGMGDFVGASSVGASGTDDRFLFTGSVTDSTPSTETGIPSAGQIMSIRYYNATSLASSTFYGAASDPSWTWVSPGDPSNPNDNMSFGMFGDGTIQYQGGVNEPETNIVFSAVPEPTTNAFMLSAVALGTVAIRRRRR